MAIISKLDNELTQLLKAQIVLKNQPDSTGTLTLSLPPDQRKYFEEKPIVRALEDLADIRLLEAEKMFLEKNERLNKDIISYFNKKKYLLPKIIKENGEIKGVEVKGKLVDLILLEFPLVTTINDILVAQQSIKDSINTEVHYVEALRRLQMKLDAAEYTEGYRIYSGGCKDRFTHDWYAIYFTAVFEALGDKLVGTNHLLSSFVFTAPLVGYLNDAMWIDDWDRKDIAPIPTKGWEGLRISHDYIIDDDRTYLLNNSSPTDSVYFIQNNRDKNVIVEWDEGVTRDVGFNYVSVDISRKISANS